MFFAIIMLYINIHFKKHRYASGGTCLESYIYAASLWMLFLFGITEVLSLLNKFTTFSLIVGWSTFNLALLLILMSQMYKKHCTIKDIYRICFSISDNKKHWYFWIFPINAFVVIYLALWTTPYNWDSMTYHLSRIVHWAQNQSVAHYATNSIRQITSPVLGEFVNLHIYLLTGYSDRLFNLLQCFCYLTCIVLIFGIAQKLKCSEKFCFLAALLYMAMPIAYAESLSTQVDHFATLWLLFFVWLLLDFTFDEKKIQWTVCTIHKVCVMGLCVAWGYLAKPSVCVGMVVFILWLLIVCIVRKDRFLTLFRLILCTIPCIVLPILPELLRNLRTFHAVSSPIAGARQLVGTFNPFLLLTNMCRNIVFNLPTVYLYDSTRFLQRIPEKLASIFGVDLNHPTITEDGRQYILSNPPNFGHDTAINPLIVWLFIFCVLIALAQFKRIRLKTMYKSYSIIASAAFLVFCAIVRWEPFVTRYLLPYLALLCPMISLQLQNRTVTENGKKLPLRDGLIGIITFICILSLCNMLICHRNQNTINRAGERPYGYFVNRTNEYEPYLAVSNSIKERGYRQIGLILAEDHYEYPFWVLLNDSVVRMEHVNVKNESSVYTDSDFSPECIIMIGPLTEAYTLNGREYSVIEEYGDDHYLLAPDN